MIQVIWEFRVQPQHVARFQQEYSDGGSWCRLFRSSTEYRGTTLECDRQDPCRFLTIDTWHDFSSYEQFRAANDEQYRKIDAEFEQLTESEKCIGIFEVL